MNTFKAYRAIYFGLLWLAGGLLWGISKGDWFVIGFAVVIGGLSTGLGTLILRREKAQQRLDETPVPEASDAGTFWRRENP